MLLLDFRCSCTELPRSSRSRAGEPSSRPANSRLGTEPNSLGSIAAEARNRRAKRQQGSAGQECSSRAQEQQELPRSRAGEPRSTAGEPRRNTVGEPRSRTELRSEARMDGFWITTGL